MTDPVSTQITELVNEHSIVLFMKGNRTFPQCGFSAAVIDVLNRHGAKYHAVNVLSDQDLREGIKVFSSWPTIPQLYIKGEFIGGCDIVRELDESGELAEKLQTAS